VLKHINAIIERENKTSTYKFALLRAIIEIIGSDSRFIEPGQDRCRIPLSMIAEKWILYYYPLLQQDERITQISKRSMAFEQEFRPVIEYYKNAGDISLLYAHLRDGSIPAVLIDEMEALFRKVAHTIRTMPMKYIGTSIFNCYDGLFKYQKSTDNIKFSLNDPYHRICGLGMVSFPRDYFEVFSLFGSYILGEGGLLNQWADFCVRSTPDGGAQKHRVIELLSMAPVLKREMYQAKETYARLKQHKGSLHCVWTQRVLDKYEIDIDHVIPFSAHFNNDLWNLLPSHPSVNRNKSDKIPSAGLLEKRKTEIIGYWEDVSELNPRLFQQQMQRALTGFNVDGDWKELAFVRLKESCDKLIHERGFNTWEPKK
jgi:hypothetical protein